MLGLSFGYVPLVVDVSPFASKFAPFVLRATLPDLRGFVAGFDVGDTKCESPAEVILDLASSWPSTQLTPAAERYCVDLDSDGRLNITGAGLLGLAYGIHDLREWLALNTAQLMFYPGACPPNGAWGRSLAAFFERGAPSPPHYALRTYSEEGQLLALPDRGYYFPDGSNADVASIHAEAEALEAEVIPALLRLRMNTLTVLHSDVEDYVNYDLREYRVQFFRSITNHYPCSQ
jgi:hypothetical protein